jgi:hypothetical protein
MPPRLRRMSLIRAAVIATLAEEPGRTLSTGFIAAECDFTYTSARTALIGLFNDRFVARIEDTAYQHEARIGYRLTDRGLELWENVIEPSMPDPVSAAHNWVIPDEAPEPVKKRRRRKA